ncbi:CDP-alcohol phosphatidyltransferase family protein [Flavivirga spongiicola]|uniref:CDP-alcohol phosphatidyltransferase family protein n=1 Tax=Flavivirga spongiicola TaxID=421621 RepID=A0ABU7XM76_9FLAO|nr:CDP-alcohol phosphatidyltransferase family protein [Flavivirga sp. MEBiC05379]MDO5981505.1 CDP-alcohol phosphatidyltransferase family protein [Flavivirga sp. MEBiC05379]
MNEKKQLGMLTFAKDLPNICSLLGLFCTVLAIYFAIKGNFPASIIGMLWAVLFDWYDGIIARKMKGRTKEQGVFGVQLDSMIDIVSFGLLPAILLLSYGNYNIWFIPGAFLIIAANAIRLSYFNIYGLIDGKTYMGLSVDNNAIILAFIFLFENLFQHATFSILLYIIIIILSALNLSSIPIPKFTGKWVYVLIVYVLVMTSFFGYQLWR